ncbi:MAG: hypothetical protein ACKOYM_10810, partial [Actinomycetes bacterium]
MVAGVTDGDAASASRGGSDGVISRFDPNGNQRWSTQIGSAGDELLSAVAMAGEARRGTERCVAGGTTTGDLGGPSAGGADALVTALGPDGAALWTAHWGSSGSERVSAIAVDGPLIYVAGTTDGRFGDLRTDLGPGGRRDGFVAAISAADGRVQWTSRFGSASDDTVTGITTTEDGLLVLSGTTEGQLTGAKQVGGADGFLVAFRLPAGGASGSSV